MRATSPGMGDGSADRRPRLLNRGLRSPQPALRLPSAPTATLPGHCVRHEEGPIDPCYAPHNVFASERQVVRMRRLILGVALLAIIAGAATLGFAAGGHATSAPAAAPVYLYWANSTAGRGAPWAKRPAATSIGRARLDGTGVEHSFVSGTGRGPCGVALDREHIYWGEALGGKVGSPDKGGAIGRANRGGSGVTAEFIATRPNHGCGVATAGSHIYWTSWACKIVPGRGCWWAPSSSAAIVRANVDGTGVDDRFPPGLAIPRGGSCGIAVAGKYIYWMNYAESAKPATIGRANLDGTGVNKRFITGVTPGGGIAVVGGYVC